ncbi:hypothetical protein KBD20_04720 [Candidatus Saccharibacteria bacterium]|nr:hypothetical protein [Candidatus Saccharibacteria bacterium]
METEHKNKTTLPVYDSNPFTLAFNSLTKMFNTNVGWAIAILVLGFFSFIGQSISNFSSNSYSPSSPSSSQVQDYTPETLPTPDVSDTNVAAIIAIVLIVLVVLIVVIVIGTAVSVFIGGMFSYVALQSEKEKSVSFSEAWEATAKRFWRLLGAQLLAGLKIFGWTLLLIVPGIIAAFRYALLPYVIMGEAAGTKGVINSHDSTKALVKGRLMEVFGVATVAGIVPFVGSLLGITGNAALYTQMKAYSDAGVEKPKIHWLNYLGFILLGALFAFILFIGILVAIIAVAANS